MDFVPIVFTASGGMGEQFQRRYWNPLAHSGWIRVTVTVAEEDEAMKIGPWVARKRKAFWEASTWKPACSRFAVAVANCNASLSRMILTKAALSISLIEPSLEILVTFF
jgi:hypothetical protein